MWNCCQTSFCGFPSFSTSGTCGSSCCQPSCCQTSCCHSCGTSYGIGGGIGYGQESSSGSVSTRIRWCRPDCRVEGTYLPPCCVLHHAEASCCRPSYCGQSCCRPVCC
uniref:Keratin associated protein 1-5 n=1 Tax=Rhinopithecus bieti TaxID=61621 RepID=A0A2K6KW29_RHIBE